MSETLSALPTTSGAPAMGDGIPVTRGYTGSGSGVTYIDYVARILSSPGLVYAQDPQYGVIANGVTDDTVAWNNALAAAFNKGTWVVAPIGSVSVVSSLTIPAGVGIIGRLAGSYSGGVGATTLGSVIKVTSSTAPGISLGQFSQLRDLQVNGNSSQPCISTSGYADLFNVTAFNGSVGIAGTVGQPSNRILYCRIHDCGTAGITGAYDTTIENTVISVCGSGITLANGVNSCRVVACKIENCTNYGISADGSGGSILDLTLAHVGFDANGKCSVRLNLVTSGEVTGCNFARSSQGQIGAPGSADDAHVYLANCKGVIITGNGSRTGLNNSNGGYNSPYYAIYDGGSNTNCIIGMNGLAYHNNAVSSVQGPINSTATFNLASGLNQSYWS